MNKIVIQIDELLIQGIDSLDPSVLQQTLQRALSEQIASHGIPDGWRPGTKISQVQASYPAENANSELIGQQTAQLVYGGKS